MIEAVLGRICAFGSGMIVIGAGSSLREFREQQKSSRKTRGIGGALHKKISPEVFSERLRGIVFMSVVHLLFLFFLFKVYRDYYTCGNGAEYQEYAYSKAEVLTCEILMPDKDIIDVLDARQQDDKGDGHCYEYRDKEFEPFGLGLKFFVIITHGIHTFRCYSDTCFIQIIPQYAAAVNGNATEYVSVPAYALAYFCRILYFWGCHGRVWDNGEIVCAAGLHLAGYVV